MLEALLKDLEIKEQEKLMVMVNGTGDITLMELLLVYRQCHKTLATKNIEVAASLVGEYLTVQEMCGFQLCIARMDEEMIKYWQAPCKTPYHTV